MLVAKLCEFRHTLSLLERLARRQRWRSRRATRRHTCRRRAHRCFLKFIQGGGGLTVSGGGVVGRQRGVMRVQRPLKHPAHERFRRAHRIRLAHAHGGAKVIRIVSASGQACAVVAEAGQREEGVAKLSHGRAQCSCR